MRIRYLLMIIILLTVSVVSGIFPAGGAAADTWWDAAWSYRRPVAVTDTSGSGLTQYQVKITVPYNAHNQPDYDDIRFVDSDDATPLPHWRQSYTPEEAVFWVKVPSIPSLSTRNIYLYYGNPAAASASDIHTTFMWGDDFETPAWTSTNLNPVNFWGSTQYVQDGEYHMSGPETSEPIAEMWESGAMKPFPDNYVAEVDFKPVLVAGGAFIAPRYIETENKYEAWVDTEWNYALLTVKLNGDWYIVDIAPLGYTVTAGTWYRLKTVVTREGDVNRLEIFVNDVSLINATDPALAYTGLAILLYDWNGPFHMTFDNVRAREYAASEPVLTIGAEESYGTNRPPVAVNDNYAASQGTTLNIAAPGVLGNDTDPDGDPLTAVKVTDPANGALTLNAGGGFTYTPAAGYTGADSFTYLASDGQLDSNTATVTITVNGGNRPPVAVNDNYAASQGTTLNIAAPGVLGNDTDPDGNPLTAVKVTDPANGALTLNAGGGFTYTPAAGYTGPDSFTYLASDGQLDSNTATVSITVNAAAPEMFEGYGTFNAADGFFGPYWRAQGFTSPAAHTITRARLSLIRVGNPAGDIIVSLRETDAAGRPTGPDLASSSIPAGSVSTAWAQNWYDFYLGAGYPLTPGKQYALVWRAPGADESNPIYYLTSSAGTYAGGHLTTSAGGAAWADMAAYDALFQEWGVTGGPANYPPVLSPIGDKTVVAGQLLQFVVTATDPENDPLVFSAGNLPGDANFDAGTGTFSWTPAAAGTFPGIHFEVSDGTLTDFEDISITVTEAGTPEMFEGYGTFNAADGFFGPYWRAQGFTSPAAHTITRARLSLIRVGNPAGDIIVSLRETDAAGRPTGPDLASGSIPAGSVSTAWAQNWYDFYLGAGYPLTPGKQYAIVWRAPGADESNPIYYLASSAGTYAGGHLTTSAGGAAWADMAAYDALFQEWGAAG